MNTNILRLIAKILIIAIVAALVGSVFGVTTLYAEILYNQYVNAVGYVANPGTYGWYSGNVLAIFGIATSTTDIYLIYCWPRIWHHEPSPPNLLQAEQYVQWFNSVGGSTGNLYSSGYGDRGVTNSYFGTYYDYGNGYRTSYPGNSGSCYNYWYKGDFC